MKIEIVWIAFDGHYATTTLENITDIQVLNGVTLFFSDDNLSMGVSVSKLVYFKRI